MTTFAVAWLIQDWFNALLNELHSMLGQLPHVIEELSIWAVLPFIFLFNLIVAPGALVVAVLEPLCGCGAAVATPVLIALAVFCGLTSGSLWLYRRR